MPRGFFLNTLIQHLANEHKSSSKNALVWEKQPSRAPAGLQPTVVWSKSLSTLRDVHAAGVQKWSCAYRSQNQLSHLKLFLRMTCIYIFINSSTMQKTSSSPSHTYKPLPKKGRSQSFHLCFPVRRCGVCHRASVFLPPLTPHWPFSQAVSPGSMGSPLHVHVRILLPRLKWSLTYCILYFTWAPNGLHQLCGACSCKCSYFPSTK